MQAGSTNSKIDGVILDVDGTIWNTTEIVAEAWNRAVRDMSFNAKRVYPSLLKSEFGKTMENIADDIWPNLTKEEKKRLMAECCKNEQEALSLLNTAGYRSAKDICYEGVIDTIKKLCKAVPFFIVSNCQKGYIEMVLNKNNIEECITDYECYGNTGEGKAFNIKALAVRNNLLHPVYVGDTKGDAVSCAKAGVTFIWAAYGFGRGVEAKYKIESFKEIESVIYF